MAYNAANFLGATDLSGIDTAGKAISEGIQSIPESIQKEKDIEYRDDRRSIEDAQKDELYTLGVKQKKQAIESGDMSLESGRMDLGKKRFDNRDADDMDFQDLTRIQNQYSNKLAEAAIDSNLDSDQLKQLTDGFDTQFNRWQNSVRTKDDAETQKKLMNKYMELSIKTMKGEKISAKDLAEVEKIKAQTAASRALANKYGREAEDTKYKTLSGLTTSETAGASQLADASKELSAMIAKRDELKAKSDFDPSDPASSAELDQINRSIQEQQATVDKLKGMKSSRTGMVKQFKSDEMGINEGDSSGNRKMVEKMTTLRTPGGEATEFTAEIPMAGGKKIKMTEVQFRDSLKDQQVPDEKIENYVSKYFK